MAVPDDPDAIWKPGYDGPVLTGADASRRGSGPDGPRSGSTRRITRIAAVSVVAVVAASIGAFIVSRGDGSGPVPASPRNASPAGDAGPNGAGWSDRQTLHSVLATERDRFVLGSSRPRSFPDRVTPRWSATLDVRVDQVATVAATSQVLVVAHGSPPVVEARSARDGQHWWTANGPGAAITAFGVIDGIVVTAAVGANGSGRIRALDGADGAILWQRPTAASERIHVNEVILAERVRAAPGRPAGVERLDPRTGQVVETVPRHPGTRVRVGPVTVQRTDADGIDWFPLDRFEPAVRMSWDRLHAAIAWSRSEEVSDVPIESAEAVLDAVLVVARDGAVDVVNLADPRPWTDVRFDGATLVERSPAPSPPMVLLSSPGRDVVVEAATGEVRARGLRPGRSATVDGYALTGAGSVLIREGQLEGTWHWGETAWRLPLAPDEVAWLVDGGVVVAEPDGAAGTRLRFLG